MVSGLRLKDFESPTTLDANYITKAEDVGSMETQLCVVAMCVTGSL